MYSLTWKLPWPVTVSRNYYNSAAQEKRQEATIVLLDTEWSVYNTKANVRQSKNRIARN